ncbi:MAG: DUF3119 family protein [Cyanobacteria bacterium P01_H01_bin.119]
MAVSADSAVVELSPSYRLSLGIIGLALPVGLISVWGSLVPAALGLFLLAQTRAIRLRFTETALEVYRGDRQLRSFPYQDWQYWRIFWQPVPILFYFREINSIHFLPVLFNPAQLHAQLTQHCPLDQLAQRQPD